MIKTFENEAKMVYDSDYLNYVTITSTKKQRDLFHIGDIFINAAICLKCKDYIRSINRYDFKRCECGAIGVDGGSWYARRVGEPENRIDIIEKFK